MNRIVFLLVIIAAFMGCTSTKLLNVTNNYNSSTAVTATQEANRSLTEIVNAIDRREYISLFYSIKQTNIPVSILNKLSASDRIKLIMAEKKDNSYKDYCHIIENALAVNLTEKGYQVISKSAAEINNSNSNFDKYLFVTVYEAGIQYAIANSGKTRFAGFRINLELVNPQTSIILISDIMSAVTSETLTQQEFDGLTNIKLKSTNADMPLTLGGVSTNADLNNLGKSHSMVNSVTFAFRLGQIKRNAQIARADGTIVDAFKIPTTYTYRPKAGDTVEMFKYKWDCSGILEGFPPNYKIILVNENGIPISERAFTIPSN